ncbi:MAG: YdbL family protein [Desulfovibrio sp.]
MKFHNKTRFIYALALILTFTLCSAAMAQGIKDRMKNRLPAITQLKQTGAIGENNAGMLQVLSGGSGQAVVNAENADRQKVYQAIAKQQNVSPDFVAKRRAAQIRSKAPAGEMLQKPDGSWYKK